MERIGTPTAVNNTFTEGNPQGGIPATEFSADWCNALQGELASLVEGESLNADPEELDPLRMDQVREAVHRVVKGRRSVANEIVNGDFQVWQRGLSHSVGNTVKFGPDRFFLRADTGAGTGAATVSRQLFATGQNTVPGRPVYYCRFLQTAGSTVGAPAMGQRLDALDQYLGARLQISLWAKGDAAYQPTLKVDRNFGTGGSATDNVHSEAFSVNTTWARHVFDVEVADYGAQTLGPFDYLEVRIELPAATVFQFDIADVLVQVGDYATAYPREDLPTVAARCQRFYEKSYALAITPGTSGSPGGYAVTQEDANAGCEGLATRFRHEKRKAPTMTWFSPVTGTSGVVRVAGADQPVASTTGANESGTGFPNLGAGTGSNLIVTGHWTADAEI